MPLFAIKDIKPNPFRHIDRYPIRREKIAALRESLRTTGYWGNVVARAVNGGAEIAYGHHRLKALQEEFGRNQKVDLLIRDLSDDAMLQIMARDNMEEWGTSAAVEHETIRAVVEALADDRIHLPPVSGTTKKSQIRYAPSFMFWVEDDCEPARHHAYTDQLIAEFIGWLQPSGRPQQKVHDALAALQFIQEGLLRESDFEGLTTSQARAVISETRKAQARRETAARAHKIQAEQAIREAAEALKKREQAESQQKQREADAAAAQKRREEAERERRKREAEAAKAHDEAARLRALEQAERAAREQQKAEQERQQAREEARRSEQQRREAEKSRLQARKRQRAAEQKAQIQTEEGRRSAESVGRAVSEELKAGRIGYKKAGEIAAKLEGKKAGPLADIENFTQRLMTEINKILVHEYDQRAVKLGQVAKHREYLRDITREDAAQTLRQAGDRFYVYANDLWPEKQGTAKKSDRKQLPNR